LATKHFKTENFSCKRSPGYLIRRMNNLVMPRAEALFSDTEITFSHWVSLVALRDGIASTAAGIARLINQDTGAVTRLIDQLETRGLFTRTREKSDRRVIKLSLTAEGRAVSGALTPRLVDFWNGVLEDCSRSDISTWIAISTKIVEALDATPVVEHKKPARKVRVAR
jgi:DNA-binding MarR family transcriptional regulator